MKLRGLTDVVDRYLQHPETFDREMFDGNIAQLNMKQLGQLIEHVKEIYKETVTATGETALVTLANASVDFTVALICQGVIASFWNSGFAMGEAPWSQGTLRGNSTLHAYGNLLNFGVLTLNLTRFAFTIISVGMKSRRGSALRDVANKMNWAVLKMGEFKWGVCPCKSCERVRRRRGGTDSIRFTREIPHSQTTKCKEILV